MRMLIDGEFIESSSKETIGIKNPATGEFIDSVPLGNSDDVGRAVDAAEKAFDDWSAMVPRERGKILFKAAQIVRERARGLAEILTSEQGKPYKEARDEVLGFANVLEYYNGISASLQGGFVPLASDRYCMVLKQPVGVCGAIIPWNVPAILMGWKVGPALVTGNTMVLKPSSTSPLTDLSLASILTEAGLPKGVLNVVTGHGQAVGEPLVTNSKVRKISFTGSTETGMRIKELTSGSLKRITLELGGSDPMIVCDDVDIDTAVEGAVRGRFYNCGQTCTAVKRLFVFESIAEEYIRKLSSRISGLKVGNGMNKDVDIGPLNNYDQREKMISQMKRVRENNEGIVVTGGKIPEGPQYDNGFFYTPTLVRDVIKDSVLLKEEVFGPILPVVVVKDLDEAIELANDTRYGLGASVWTRDIKKATYATARLQSGIVWINQHTKAPADVPFGGIKDSGLGRENGLDSLYEYQEIKTVMVNV
ncbi:aldehyde dehydrogenase family protein [Methanooceanicella nereidis]|nr:aldehyde dehydrogenase family protein [Methanocella sp. CWC-04]